MLKLKNHHQQSCPAKPDATQHNTRPRPSAPNETPTTRPRRPRTKVARAARAPGTARRGVEERVEPGIPSPSPTFLLSLSPRRDGTDPVLAHLPVRRPAGACGSTCRPGARRRGVHGRSIHRPRSRRPQRSRPRHRWTRTGRHGLAAATTQSRPRGTNGAARARPPVILPRARAAQACSRRGKFRRAWLGCPLSLCRRGPSRPESSDSLPHAARAGRDRTTRGQ